MNSIDRLVEYFKVPLEGANAKVKEIRHEFEVMVSYSTPVNSFPCQHSITRLFSGDCSMLPILQNGLMF